MRKGRAYGAELLAKSIAVTRFFEQRMVSVCAAWLILTAGLALFRLSNPAGAVHKLGDVRAEILGYGLVIAAPVLGYIIARHAFTGEAAERQPTFRFALYGRWRKLSANEARSSASYGPVGFMASLLIGMLLNVVVRAFEFFTAVPVMGAHAPAWGQAMFAWMALDLVITGFFYMVAFVMALRSIPLFPRMLLYAWLLDIVMQLVIARELALVGGVPPQVVEPLLTLMDGNITKVLISVAIWLPYLVLSERVNITYRHRTNARAG